MKIKDISNKLCDLMYRLTFFMVVAMVSLLSSCGDEDDFRVTDDGDDGDTWTVKYSKDGSSGYATQLLQHSVGSVGFPIVIMADGYTQSEIDNGIYGSAVDKAVDALFGIEPMTSLKPYCDVYEVVFASNVSGITTRQRDTAFKTYHKSTSDVEIYGDTAKIENCALQALRNSKTRFSNALVIMLVNSNQYAGVTMMTGSTSVKDSICVGYSISYVPVGCKASDGKSYFTRTLQHEAIGHGIGKLDDEYYYTVSEPTDEYIDRCKKHYLYGMCLNVKYDNETDNVRSDRYLVESGKYKLLVGEHDMQPGDVGYRLAQNPAYSSEALKWYQGASTYLTHAGLSSETDSRYSAVYEVAKNFYRPTWTSLMNSVVTNEDLIFNALSRFLIYARVMKVVQGTSINIHNEEWYNRFVAFDNVSATYSSSAKAATGALPYAAETLELPPLASPHIMLR
jgi:hypothetical protein